MATSVHGVQALIVKPSQSIAPVVGVWILARFGLNANDAAGAGAGEAEAPAAIPHSAELQSAAYFLTFGVPLLCTCVQLLIWRRFDLHGEKLAAVKSSLLKRHDAREAGSRV